MPVYQPYRSPLDDLYDELGIPSPNARPAPWPQGQPSILSQTPPLQPQEESNLLETLGGKALTGIQWVGDVLDKTLGGRAIRGALGGKPEEIASILPFSDTLGISNRENRVSGEDLLKQAGVDTGSETGNMLAGIASEILLDPATYASFGASALTGPGKAAKLAGTLEKTAAGRIAAGQGGLAGFGVPPILSLLGADTTPLITLGKGQTALKAAELGGQALDWAKYTSPGRYLSSKFAPVEGAVSEEVQRGIREMRNPALETAIPEARGKVAELYQLARKPGLYDPMEVRSAMEGITSTHPELVNPTRQMLDNVIQQGKAAGRDMSVLEDAYAQYFPRAGITPTTTESISRGQRPLSSFTGSQLEREAALKNVPGGSAEIDALLKNPDIAGPARPLSTGEARNRILDRWTAEHGYDIAKAQQGLADESGISGFIADAQRQLAQPNLPQSTQATLRQLIANMEAQRQTPAHLELMRHAAMEDKAGELAKWLGSVDPQRIGPTGVGLWGDPFADLLGHVQNAAKADENARMFAKILSQPELYARGEPGGLQLGEAIKQLRLSDQAMAEITTNLQRAGMVPATIDEFAKMRLPADVSTDIMKRFSNPIEDLVGRGPLRAFDSTTLLTKAFQTAMWPAHQVRNLITDMMQAGSKGSAIPTYLEAQQIRRALGSGQPVEGLAARIPSLGVTDAEATDKLGRLIFAHEPTGRGASFHNIGDVLAGIDESRPLDQAIPGITKEPGLLDAIKSYFKGRTTPGGESVDTIGQRLNPLNIAGFGGFAGIPKQNATRFAPAAAGRNLSRLEDAMTRDSTLIENLLRGASPQAAGEAATAAHFNYGNLTDFERNVMRRIMPFYSWSRNVVPSVLEDLTRTPGGLYGQMIRAGSDARTEGGFLPPYLGAGLALPLGDESDGTRKYLTSLGLPFEDVTRLIPERPGVSGAIMNLAGNLNPLLKAPLEQLTGKQFYTGRELQDLYSQSGSQLADQLLMNSPAGRALTTGRRALDERKTIPERLLDVLTGVKTSDVDVAKSRDVAERDLLMNAMQNDPAFRKSVDFYVPKEQQPNLTPEQLAILKLAGQMKQLAQAEKKAGR